MNLYTVKIRRDAQTITPVDIPQHELPIVQTIFGEENVQTILGQSIDEFGLGDPVGEVKTPDDEYGRLRMKYGVEALEEVYGKKATGALAKAMKDFAEEEGKSKAKAKLSSGLKIDEIKAELAKREIAIPEGVTKKDDLAALLDASEAPAD